MSITQTFDQLVSEIEQVKISIKQSKHQYWSNLPEFEVDDVLNALSDYWYLDGRDGRITNAYYAAVSVDDVYLYQLNKINALKLALKKEFSQIRKDSDTQLEAIKHQLTSRNPLLARKMESEGLARLHIKQLTRMIPVLEKTPELLSFNWYQSGRSIQKVTKQQVLKLLLKLDHASTPFQIQYQILASIDDNEPLAIVQQQAPLMRLNLKYANGTRKAQNVALPIFFSNNETFPNITPPPTEHPPTRVRKRRSDNKLEDVALLPALRVFRYQSE